MYNERRELTTQDYPLEPILQKMLPFYQKLFDNLSKFNLVVSARGMGKSYNIAWGIIYRLFSQDADILVIRKTQKSLTNSLLPEIREKFSLLEDILLNKEEQEFVDFKTSFTLEKISLTIDKFFKRTIHFKGSMNPLSLKSFKSSNPINLIVFEEAEQLSERDLREIIPSFREENVTFLFLSNIPPQGRRHFLYKIFIEKPEYNYKTFQPNWQDNFILFRTLDKWQQWQEDNAPLFGGKETKSFRQAILGEWVEDTEDFLISSFQIIERNYENNLKFEISLVLFSTKIYILLIGTHPLRNSNKVFLKKECLCDSIYDAFMKIREWQKEEKLSNIRLHISYDTMIFAKLIRNQGFVSPYYKKMLSQDKWASFFKCYSLCIDFTCEIFINQAEKACYEKDDETSLISSKISRNTEIYALEALALYLSPKV